MIAQNLVYRAIRLSVQVELRVVLGAPEVGDEVETSEGGFGTVKEQVAGDYELRLEGLRAMKIAVTISGYCSRGGGRRGGGHDYGTQGEEESEEDGEGGEQERAQRGWGGGGH